MCLLKTEISLWFSKLCPLSSYDLFDNMAFALKLRGEDKQTIKKKVQHAAELLGIQDLLKRKPAQLSGDSVNVWL